MLLHQVLLSGYYILLDLITQLHKICTISRYPHYQVLMFFRINLRISERINIYDVKLYMFSPLFEISLHQGGQLLLVFIIRQGGGMDFHVEKRRLIPILVNVQRASEKTRGAIPVLSLHRRNRAVAEHLTRLPAVRGGTDQFAAGPMGGYRNPRGLHRASPRTREPFRLVGPKLI